MSGGEQSGGGRDAGAAEHTEAVADVAEGTSEALGGAIAGSIDSPEGDHTAEDVERAFDSVGQGAGAVAQGAKAWHETERAVSAAQDGDGWGAAAHGLGAAAGTSGHLAGALGSIGAATNDQGFREAASVARGVGAAASFAGTVARHAGDAVRHAEAAGRAASRHVEYELHVEDVEERWRVRHFAMTEALNEPYEVVLELQSEHEDASPSEMLGKNAELLLDRRDHVRRVCGVVRRVVETASRAHHVTCTVHVVPALWVLRQQTDSRIFQEMTAPDILEEVLGTALGRFRREIDRSDLGASYPRREYCVQYRETLLDFAHRLMEEEGIGYYFECAGEGWEKLVLFDRNGALEDAPTLDGGAIPFVARADVVAGVEPIVALHDARQLTTTGVVVRDYDWTQSSPRVEARREGADEQGRSRLHYDHGHAGSVTIWDYSGDRYGQNDAERQAQVRDELLRRAGHVLEGVSLVTGLAPGRTFTLRDHPTPGFDGEYVVTRVRHVSEAPPGVEGGGAEEYHNRFECIPVAREYRPERRARKPRIYGIQTAHVTGPGDDGEIFTDYYGRIKVLFPWDREGGEPGRTSCWIRVSQTWAGFDGMGHPGFVFIPRVGMEVIVTFVDGDPDRPLVTGTVYNARNLPPEALPDEASRSMIRTRSLGGTGYNELSFEDAAGREEVHLRAERNLRELVQHDHTTHVQANQRNTVDGNQTNTVGGDQEETVRGNQTMTVEQVRKHHVIGHEEHTVDEWRRLEVKGNDYEQINGSRNTTINQHNDLHVVRSRSVYVEEDQVVRIGAGLRQTIAAGGWTMNTTGNVRHQVAGDHQLAVGGTSMLTSSSDTTIHASNILLSSDTQVSVLAPNGLVELAQSNSTRNHSSLMERIAEHIEVKDTSIKLYRQLAVSIGTFKLDTWGAKADFWGVKISTNKGPEISTAAAKISNAIATIFR